MSASATRFPLPWWAPSGTTAPCPRCTATCIRPGRHAGTGAEGHHHHLHGLHSAHRGHRQHDPSYRVVDGQVRPLYFYSVDISEFAVNKLRDRGSLSVKTIVTNVQDFIVHVRKASARRRDDSPSPPSSFCAQIPQELQGTASPAPGGFCLFPPERTGNFFLCLGREIWYSKCVCC